MEYDSENLNSEEIYSSLRGVTEAIQNFSFRSQEDLMEPLRRDGKRDGLVRTETAPVVTHGPNVFSALMVSVSQAGVGASSESDPRLSADVVDSGRTALDNKTSLLNTPSPRSFSGPRFREYNPYNYTDASVGAADKSGLYEDAVEQLRDGEDTL